MWTYCVFAVSYSLSVNEPLGKDSCEMVCVVSFQIKLLKLEREDALKHRDRLSIMREEKDSFLAKLKEARMSVYKVSIVLKDLRLRQICSSISTSPLKV